MIGNVTSRTPLQLKWHHADLFTTRGQFFLMLPVRFWFILQWRSLVVTLSLEWFRFFKFVAPITFLCLREKKLFWQHRRRRVRFRKKNRTFSELIFSSVGWSVSKEAGFETCSWSRWSRATTRAARTQRWSGVWFMTSDKKTMKNKTFFWRNFFENASSSRFFRISA